MGGGSVGARTVLSWLAPDEVESPDVADRALGVCFTVDGRVVLVSGDGRTSGAIPAAAGNRASRSRRR